MEVKPEGGASKGKNLRKRNKNTKAQRPESSWNVGKTERRTESLECGEQGVTVRDEAQG